MNLISKRLHEAAYKNLLDVCSEYNEICDTLEIPEMKLGSIKFNYELRDANDSKKTSETKDRI